jgi:hypothetical protein
LLHRVTRWLPVCHTVLHGVWYTETVAQGRGEFQKEISMDD